MRSLNKKNMTNTKSQLMTFAEAREFFTKLDQEKAVAGRFGMYTAHIIYKNALYKFKNIKMNYSGRDDIFGFGLNHYFWLPGNHIASMPTRSSFFHDSEDVSVDIKEDQFVSAELSTGRIRAFKEGPFVTIETKKCKVLISWD